MSRATLISTVVALSGFLRATSARETPVSKVVDLLKELKTHIVSDGEAEQASYDKYACWCEETLGQKASDISAAKTRIEELQTKITGLSGGLGSNGAEIKQLKKDIAANIESTREATEIRDKEAASYEEEKTESEQCIGALEAAIKVLAGAGTKSSKKGFLQTLQEAQVLSVVAGLRGVLRRPAAAKFVDTRDLQVLQQFVSKPDDFMEGRSGVLSAAQIENNPFGDYAPQSSQVQGILKSMYDAFTASLEKSNGEEAGKQKAFEDLTATKKKELETLQATLEAQTQAEAQKTKERAESRTALDDTQAQLSSDEEFFSEAKSSCQAKAGKWAERSRLRTETLHGITQAVAILSSPEAKATFENATTTLLQVANRVRPHSHFTAASQLAYEELKAKATRLKSLSLAGVAAAVQRSGGHFDKVIASIERMVEMLRQQEKDDIDHRDRCQASQGKNKQELEDLERAVKKSEASMERMEDKADELTKKVEELTGSVNATEEEMKELVDMRTKERAEFLQGQKDDADAVALLEQAIAALSKALKDKDSALLVKGVKHGASPTSANAPEVEWKGDGRRSEEHKGLVSILFMIKEDLEKEMKSASGDDAQAQAIFVKDRQALANTLKSHKRSKVGAETELAELHRQIAREGRRKDAKEADKAAEEELEASLGKDCAWVETHFGKRQEQRTAEIDGLIEAKSYLAGMVADA